MKRSRPPAAFAALLFLLPCAPPLRAADLAVPNPPPPLFADTESATNAPLHRAAMARARLVRAELSLSATASNQVEVAFGNARGAGGELLPGDEAFAFGWENGAWFVACETNRFDAAAAGTNAARRTLAVSMRLRGDGSPLAFEAREAGATNALFASLADAPPPWLFSRGWDAVRLTVRGTDPRDEAAALRLDADAGVLILR